MPAPFIYGIMSQIIDDQATKYQKQKYSSIPMLLLVYTSLVGISVFTQAYREKYGESKRRGG